MNKKKGLFFFFNKKNQNQERASRHDFEYIMKENAKCSLIHDVVSSLLGQTMQYLINSSRILII
jgi:hypothetical protein